jgi:hypothetical protein
VDAKRVCITDPNIEVVLNSRVTLRVSGRQSVLTVLQGSAEVTRPTRATLDQYYQYAVDEWARRAYGASHARGGGGRGAVDKPQLAGMVLCSRRFPVGREPGTAARGSSPISVPGHAPGSGWCCASGKFSRRTRTSAPSSAGSSLPISVRRRAHAPEFWMVLR